MESVIHFLIANYGTLGVMIILLGGMGWFIVKELRTSNKRLIDTQAKLNASLNSALTDSLSVMTTRLTESIQCQNDKLVDHIIGINNHDKVVHTENVLERIGLTEEIKAHVKDIRLTTQAVRALVLEFHNSFENLSGFPFAKYTATYESLSKGVLPIMQNCSGLQFSSISSVVEKIYDPNNLDHMVICGYKGEKELSEMCPIVSVINKNSTNIVLFKGLFDTHNHLLIGLLVLEFREEDVEELDKVEVKLAASAIAELITLTNTKRDYLLHK